MSLFSQEGGRSGLATENISREDQASEAEGVIFLYRLVEGRSSNSHGYECALSAGVPHAVRHPGQLRVLSISSSRTAHSGEYERHVFCNRLSFAAGFND